MASVLLIAIRSAFLPAQPAPQRLWFDSARPLAKAADEFEKAYGWVVNYEDVPVFGADTLHDAAHRAVVPNGVPFGFVVPADRVAQPVDVLRDLVTAYQNSNNPGRFQVRPVTGLPLTFDLVPHEYRDANGQRQPLIPLLDTPISMPSGKRRAYDVLLAIRDALAEASKSRVTLGGAGFNLNGLMQKQVDIGATNEPAREVLRRFLREYGTGDQRPSWRILCDPGDRFCAINVHWLPALRE